MVLKEGNWVPARFEYMRFLVKSFSNPRRPTEILREIAGARAQKQRVKEADGTELSKEVEELQLVNVALEEREALKDVVIVRWGVGDEEEVMLRAREEPVDNGEKLSMASKYETLKKIGKKLAAEGSVAHVPVDKELLDAVGKVRSRSLA